MELVLEALQAVMLLFVLGAVAFLAPLAIVLVFALVSGFTDDHSGRIDDRDDE